MNETQLDMIADLRAEESACAHDAFVEDFENLGIDRQMEIITDRLNENTNPEVWSHWLSEYEFEEGQNKELISWLRTEEAGVEERLEIIGCLYDMDQGQIYTRFIETPEDRKAYEESLEQFYQEEAESQKPDYSNLYEDDDIPF